MKSFKKLVLFLHRWLGLITGLVVFILGITGCLFVFQHEIKQWVRHDLLYVHSPHHQTLPVKVLQQEAAKALGVEYLPYGLTTYKNPKRTWSVMYYKGGGESWTYFGTIKDYRTLYINPYTGEVAGIINEEKDFFQIVKGIHWSLMLATPIGQPVVVWSTLIFIIMLITGMVLWWPKRWSKADRQKSFKMKWGSTWRRINYDLHNVLGFYFLLISLILAFTGLYWYFPWAQKSMNFIATNEFELPEPTVKKVTENQPAESISKPLQVAYTKAWKAFPQAHSITIVAPRNSPGFIRADVRPDGNTYYKNHSLAFSEETGQIVQKRLTADMSTGLNYDIHVGSMGGLPGKIIAFLASLLAASLPVSGFIIWWDRRKRKQQRGVKRKVKLSNLGKKNRRRSKKVRT